MSIQETVTDWIPDKDKPTPRRRRRKMVSVRFDVESIQKMRELDQRWGNKSIAKTIEQAIGEAWGREFPPALPTVEPGELPTVPYLWLPIKGEESDEHLAVLAAKEWPGCKAARVCLTPQREMILVYVPET